MTQLLLAASGVVLVVLALIDMFLTVFNYDGYRFISERFQRVCWRIMRGFTAALPGGVGDMARSVASATLLPLTVAMWLGVEVTGFALIYSSGLSAGVFHLSNGLPATLGSAFYLSAGGISTLTFGDVEPVGGIYRAATVLQAIIGLSTFTLALGYVVTSFSVLGDLMRLHNTVRRHARDDDRPTSVLARHYQGGQATELPDLLQQLSTSLDAYDEGLRRYPVVFFVHSRNSERSIPSVFSRLGTLLAALRWGLPAGDAMTDDPWLAALFDQYEITVRRLQRSFVGPIPLPPVAPATRSDFERTYGSSEPDGDVATFRELQERTRRAIGCRPAPDDPDTAYGRYREWFPFHHRGRAVLSRIARALGYAQ